MTADAPSGFLARYEIALTAGMAGLYFALFSVLAVLRHQTFHSFGLDLGIFDQIFWNTVHGRPFESTMSLGLAQPHSFFSDHFSPLLIALVPFYAAVPRPETLVVLQTAALALGALPVYLAARAHLPAGLERLLWPVAYLLFVPLAHINLYDFHEIALAVLPLGLAVHFLDRRRWLPAAASLTIALLAKEEVAVVAAGIGVYLLLVRGSRRAGLAVLAASLAWFALVVGAIVPALGQGRPYVYFVERYGWLGRNPIEMAANAITHPLTVAHQLLQRPKLAFVAALLGPVLGAPLLAGWAAITLVAPLAYLLLSDYAPQFSFTTQYSAPLIPLVLITAVWGYARLAPRARAGYGVAILVASLGFCYLLGDLPFSRKFDPSQFQPEARYVQFETALAAIPPDASVASENNVTPHVTQRRFVYDREFEGDAGARYLVLDYAATGRDLARHQAEITAAEQNGYRVIATAYGLALLER